MFGVARGFLLAVVAFAIFNWLVSEKQQPEWVKNAKTRPVLTETADKIVALLPEDAASTIDAWIKSRGEPFSPANEEPHDESAAPRRPSRPRRPRRRPGAQKKAESPATTPSSTLDKQKLDAIINKNVPAPAPAAPAVVPKH